MPRSEKDKEAIKAKYAFMSSDADRKVFLDHALKLMLYLPPVYIPKVAPKARPASCTRPVENIPFEAGPRSQSGGLIAGCPYPYCSTSSGPC